jgi:hypothetical protein
MRFECPLSENIPGARTVNWRLVAGLLRRVASAGVKLVGLFKVRSLKLREHLQQYQRSERRSKYQSVKRCELRCQVLGSEAAAGLSMCRDYRLAHGAKAWAFTPPEVYHHLQPRIPRSLDCHTRLGHFNWSGMLFDKLF